MLKELSLSPLTKKISAPRQKADAVMTRARVMSNPADAEKEFMMSPLLHAVNNLLGIKQPADHYTSVNQSARQFFTDPATHDAIMRTAMKATQANRNKRPFEISIDAEEVPDSEFVYDVLHNVFEALGIYKRSTAFARDLLMEGQTFYRVFVDRDRLVGLKKIKGPRSGFRIEGPVMDDSGEKWYLQFEAASGKLVNIFYEWEVIPFFWNPDEEMGLGTPMTIASFSAHDRQKTGADSLRVARLTRAFPKKFFKYDATLTRERFLQAVNNYKEDHDNLSLEDDAFSDEHTQADVKILDLSSPALYQIGDIEYHERDKKNALMLPFPFYDGGGQTTLNRSVIEVYYQEWVSNSIAAVEDALEGDFETSGLRKIIDLQLALIGKRYWNTPVSLEWTNKQRLTKEEADALDSSFDRVEISPITYLYLKHNIDAEKQLAETAKYNELKRDILGEDPVQPTQAGAQEPSVDDENSENDPEND